MTGDFTKWLGLPFRDLGRDWQGVDCWGVIRLAYAEDLGIALPSYTDGLTSALDRDEVRRLFQTEMAHTERGPWHPVAKARAYDVVLFRMGRFGTHAGLAIDARAMLHVHAQSSAVIQRFDLAPWCNLRWGIFRHEALR